MCSTVFYGQRTCPRCGYEIPDYGRRIEALEAELQEVTPDKKQGKSPWEEKATFYGMCEWYRREKGYKSGWSAHKYREKLGVWPRDVDIGPIPPNREFYNFLTYLNIKWRRRQEAMTA